MALEEFHSFAAAAVSGAPATSTEVMRLKAQALIWLADVLEEAAKEPAAESTDDPVTEEAPQ